MGESSLEKPAYLPYYKFLCPARPVLRQFLAQRVEELAQYDELSGIHLDYIRYPDVILAAALQPHYGIVQDREYPEYDYCYCEVCRRDFKESAGVDPLDIEDPSRNQQWRQFRCDRITHIVNDILIPIGRRRHKAMTAAVFPNWEHVRQQWQLWDLDGVLPMLYHHFYNEGTGWIKEKCRQGIGALEKDIPLYSGLMVDTDQPEQLDETIAASRAGGAAGISLFSAAGMSAAHWKIFAAAAQRWKA